MLETNTLFKDTELIILDIDGTLTVPGNTDFYNNFGEAVNTSLARVLQQKYVVGKQVADHYRRLKGGGEHAFVDTALDAALSLNGLDIKLPRIPLGFQELYEAFCEIDSTGYFKPDLSVLAFLRALKKRGLTIVGLTDNAEDLSRRILIASEIDPDKDFDLYLPWKRESDGPPKFMNGQIIFQQILGQFSVSPSRAISVGDSLTGDILPAHNVGMKTCLISSVVRAVYDGVQVMHVRELTQYIE